jgi:hypothetical protein
MTGRRVLGMRRGISHIPLLLIHRMLDQLVRSFLLPGLPLPEVNSVVAESASNFLMSAVYDQVTPLSRGDTQFASLV